MTLNGETREGKVVGDGSSDWSCHFVRVGHNDGSNWRAHGEIYPTVLEETWAHLRTVFVEYTLPLSLSLSVCE